MGWTELTEGKCLLLLCSSEKISTAFVFSIFSSWCWFWFSLLMLGFCNWSQLEKVGFIRDNFFYFCVIRKFFWFIIATVRSELLLNSTKTGSRVSDLKENVNLAKWKNVETKNQMKYFKGNIWLLNRNSWQINRYIFIFSENFHKWQAKRRGDICSFENIAEKTLSKLQDVQSAFVDAKTGIKDSKRKFLHSKLTTQSLAFKRTDGAGRHVKGNVSAWFQAANGQFQLT